MWDLERIKQVNENTMKKCFGKGLATLSRLLLCAVIAQNPTPMTADVNAGESAYTYTPEYMHVCLQTRRGGGMRNKLRIAYDNNNVFVRLRVEDAIGGEKR